MALISGFLFDVDGTLVDSNDQHAHSWIDGLAEFDIKAEYQTLRNSIGMGGDHILRDLFKIDPESKQGSAIRKRVGQIFRGKYLKEVKAFDGAEELLRTLKSKAFKLIIATSASEKDLNEILEQTQLSNIVDLATTSSDANSSKPSPDIIEAALAKARLNAQTSLMVGDTPYDVEAAARASVKSIALESGGWSAQDLKQAGASVTYRGTKELLEAVKTGRLPF